MNKLFNDLLEGISRNYEGPYLTNKEFADILQITGDQLRHYSSHINIPFAIMKDAIELYFGDKRLELIHKHGKRRTFRIV